MSAISKTCISPSEIGRLTTELSQHARHFPTLREGRPEVNWIQVTDGIVYKNKAGPTEQTSYSHTPVNANYTPDIFGTGPQTYETEVITDPEERLLKKFRLTKNKTFPLAASKLNQLTEIARSQLLAKVEERERLDSNSVVYNEKSALKHAESGLQFPPNDKIDLNNRHKSIKPSLVIQAASNESMKIKSNLMVDLNTWKPNVDTQMLQECLFLRDELAADLIKMEFEQWVPNTFDAKESLSVVKPGGIYEPTDCFQKFCLQGGDRRVDPELTGSTSRQVTAVLIPNFHREDIVNELVQFLHYFLQRQHKAYILVFATQENASAMNRASMINIAVLEITKRYPVDCFIIHDIDTFPLNWRNDYSCKLGSVRQLLASRDTENFKPKYMNYMGGVTAISKKDFFLVNGMSNLYWSWGGEDDDMRIRVARSGLQFLRTNDLIGRYKHKHRGARIRNPLW
ncbi:Galactosyltransferase N-terminal [Trinorchestia longiramus]|nr:Galactosyltransferase N-terminal [Trinorchestia longiramus]